MNHVVYMAPSLENGEHLDQKTFHERYLATPPGFKAELVEGMVFVASPLRAPHAEHHALIMEWLGRYRTATPGVRLLDKATAILGEESEPQPDASLALEPACGGRSRVNEDEYLVGPPELVVEVSHSSRSFDLFEKRRDYEQAGVLEYIVVAIRDRRVHWFVLEDGAFSERAISDDAMLRSAVFPGLWLDTSALFRLDPRAVVQALEGGLASAEYVAFAERIATMRGGQ